MVAKRKNKVSITSARKREEYTVLNSGAVKEEVNDAVMEGRGE